MAEKWVDIFALSQYNLGRVKLPFGDRTVRIIIRNYVSGNKLKLTLANRYSKSDINIAKVTVANCDSEGNHITTPKIIQFNGESHGILHPRSSLPSDDIEYNVQEGYIAVNVLFKGKASTNSLNMLREKVIISSKGDFTESDTIEEANRITEKILNKAFKIAGVPKCDMIPALESVSVYSDYNNKTIIAFGDSISQGGKWTYELAERLNIPVLNLGISGNRLLRDGDMPILHGLFGEAAIKRFDRDVLTRQGAGVVIVLLGTNDIGQPGTVITSKKEAVTADDIINGLTSLAIRIKSAGFRAIVCTLTPFKYFRMGYIGNSYEVRHAVNAWIRDNNVFDMYYDYDAMIRDVDEPEMIAKPYDSGDHLHPSDQGSIKMLDAIDIEVLRAMCKGDVR